MFSYNYNIGKIYNNGKGEIFDVKVVNRVKTLIFEEGVQPFTGMIDISKNSATQKKTLLLVDDDNFTRQVYKTYFERNNYIVKEAGNGKEAINMVNADSSISLVLLDLLMPTHDGFIFLRHFAEHERPGGENIHVVLVTSMDPEDYQNNVSVMHINTNKVKGFFNKPVDLRELFKMVDRLGQPSGISLTK